MTLKTPKPLKSLAPSWSLFHSLFLHIPQLYFNWMDRGKMPGGSRTLNNPNNSIYLDLRDIVREHALCYLPAKSLCKCRSVCRDWKLQTSSPFFAHRQSYFFSSLSGLFCKPSGDALSFISCDTMAHGVPDPELKFLPEPVELVASSNGLLCCRGRDNDNYYVTNPVSQQWKKLPKPDANHGPSPALVLIFEPSLVKFVAEFKIVCAFPSADIDGAYEFEIYSSVDDSWKISPEICFSERTMIFQRGGVHVNGVVYWIASSCTIIGFDLKKNRSTVITSPDYMPLSTFTLGVMDGKLCASERKGSKIMVWELSNVYANTMQLSSEHKQWVKQQFELSRPGLSFGLSNERVRSVLAAVGDLIVFKDGDTIYSYNMMTKEMRSLSIDSGIYCCHYVPYVNSLVCL